MKIDFLIHQWKYFLRGRDKNRGIAEQAILSIFALLILTVTLFAGLSLPIFLQSRYGKANAITAFFGLVLPYFGIDIIIRFFWQQLPTMVIHPYLLLNIRKKQIVSFLSIRSLFSFLNISPLFLFTPFISTVVSNMYGTLAAVLLTFSILFISIGNNFLTLIIKRLTISQAKCLLLFSILTVVCAVLNYYKIISFKTYSGMLLIAIIKYHWPVLFSALYSILSLYLNNLLLGKSLYYEEKQAKITGKIDYAKLLFAYFEVHGSTIGITIKSILRNKRPRHFLFLAVGFLFYGIFMFQKGMLDKSQLELPLFGSMITTGMFGISYGKSLFAWESPYFDALMTYNISIEKFIKDKFKLLILMSTIFFLLSTLYVFKDSRLIIILLAIYLFNIGLLPVIAVYFGLFNYKRLEPDRNSSVDFQGLGPQQMIYSFVWVLIAAFVYLPFRIYHHEWAGIVCIGGVGLVSYLLQKIWIRLLIYQFLKKKYKMLEGFREK